VRKRLTSWLDAESHRLSPGADSDVRKTFADGQTTVDILRLRTKLPQ